MTASTMPTPPTFVWVWLDYANRLPRHVRLNVAALHRHAPPSLGFRVVELNASSLPLWISLPKEFGSLISRKVAVSDLARIALMATYGGIYVDADVLVAVPLSPIAALLEEYEHVVYASKGQQCLRGQFSANFLISRPGTMLWTSAWAHLQVALRGTCEPHGKKGKMGYRLANRRQVACCYSADGLLLPRCMTPWAVTDRIVRPIAEDLAVNDSFSAYCFFGSESLTPWAGTRPGYWTALEESCVNQFHLSRSVVGGCYSCSNTDFDRHNAATICCERHGHDLVCRNARGARAIAVKFFSRVAYHLFESINGPTFAALGAIERSNLSVAHLYRRALYE